VGEIGLISIAACFEDSLTMKDCELLVPSDSTREEVQTVWLQSDAKNANT
jgi:hypothetical protein